MQITTAARTHRGGRENNEDSIGCRVHEKSVWAVADGLGGHNGGETASRIAVSSILEFMDNDPELSDANLLDMIETVNERINKEQYDSPLLNGMRTTVVAALAEGDLLKYINVGDSRFYLFRDNELFAMSKDHSVSQLAADLGDIKPEQIRFHEDRNRLTKVLGGDGKLNLKNQPSSIKMKSGDAFLLCSDGFWEFVYEREMEVDLLKSKNPDEWLDFMISRLLNRFENKNDNFSAMCCFVE